MERVATPTLSFIDTEVVKLIVEKYGLGELDAIVDYLGSQAYAMLVDPAMELYKVSPLIIFDMWEAEKVTGNPRNSTYIRQ